MYALTAVPGVGRRLANILCKKADVDMNKRYVHTCSEMTGAAVWWYMPQLAVVP